MGHWASMTQWAELSPCPEPKPHYSLLPTVWLLSTEYCPLTTVHWILTTNHCPLTTVWSLSTDYCLSSYHLPPAAILVLCYPYDFDHNLNPCPHCQYDFDHNPNPAIFLILSSWYLPHDPPITPSTTRAPHFASNPRSVIHICKSDCALFCQAATAVK